MEIKSREELLTGLQNATSILKQLENVQSRLENVRGQYKSALAEKKMGCLSYVIIGFLVLSALMSSGVSSQFGMGLFSAMGWIWVVVAFVGIRFYYKKKNESIAARNAQILVDNERIKAQEQTVLAELQQIQIAYREKIGSWYPSTYCYAEAAQFFYEVISNYRADNMKEAINLYENTLHQRRMEDNQKQMLKQQKLNNLLAAGSFVMQTAQVGAIQEHTAAMNSQAEATRSAIGRNTDALNKINEKLSRPTWLK